MVFVTKISIKVFGHIGLEPMTPSPPDLIVTCRYKKDKLYCYQDLYKSECVSSHKSVRNLVRKEQVLYTKNPQKVYKRSGSDVYYLNLRNPVTGEVIRKSSKTTNHEEALAVYEREQKKLNGLSSRAKLSEILALYSDATTNPRKVQANLNGSSYGDHHASIVARQARQLSELLEKKAPKLFNMEMADFTVIHIKTIKELLIKEFGRCRKSQQIFTNLKAFFSQAHEDGIIFASPCSGLEDIKYKKKIKDALPLEHLRLILSERDHMDKKLWSFVAIAITTGMRRSEILALNRDQLIDNGKSLLIDRSIKTDKRDVGLPKTDTQRIIPLSNITQSIFNNMNSDVKGDFFAGMNWSSYSHFFSKEVRKYMIEKYPEHCDIWSKMTCHSFRHSLYSHLRCNGANQLLAEEYLSWEHQNLDAMPANYLHIYAYNLQPIAEMIDKMFSEKEQKSQFAIG